MRNLGVTVKGNKVYYNASVYVSNRYLGEWEQGIDGEPDYFSFNITPLLSAYYSYKNYIGRGSTEYYRNLYENLNLSFFMADVLTVTLLEKNYLDAQKICDNKGLIGYCLGTLRYLNYSTFDTITREDLDIFEQGFKMKLERSLNLNLDKVYIRAFDVRYVRHHTDFEHIVGDTVQGDLLRQTEEKQGVDILKVNPNLNKIYDLSGTFTGLSQFYIDATDLTLFEIQDSTKEDYSVVYAPRRKKSVDVKKENVLEVLRALRKLTNKV